MKPTIIDAIKACQEENNPNVQFTINFDTLESITDLSGMQQSRNGELVTGPLSFTFEDALAKKEKLEAEYEAQTYARNRKEEYDALNQLELISDDTNNGTTTHIDAINAIKAKWPKDNSGPV